MTNLSRKFNIEVHASRIQIKSNRIVTHLKATCAIDSQIIHFQNHAEVKRNIGSFDCFIYFENVQIPIKQFGYGEKKMKIQLFFVDQHPLTRAGQININLGEVLNKQKYLVHFIYPLQKCYDIHANLKLSIDFQSIYNSRKNSEHKAMFNREKQPDIINDQQNFKKISTLESKIKQLQEKSQQYQSKLRILENQLNNRNVALDRLGQNNQRFIQERRQLKLELQTARKQIQQLKLENQSIKINIQQLEERNIRISQLYEENCNLHLKLKDKTNEYLSMKQAKQKLIEVYQYAVSQKQQITKKYDSSNSQNELLKRQNQSLKNFIISSKKKQQMKQKYYQQQYNKFNDKINQLQQQKQLLILKMQAELQSQHQNLQSEFKQSYKLIENKIIQMNKSSKQGFDELNQKINQKQIQIALKNSQLSTARILKENLQNQILMKQAQVNRLNKLIQKSNEKYSQLQNQYQNLLNKSIFTESQLKKMQTKVFSLTNSLQQTILQLQFANQTIKQQNNTLSLKNNEILQLKQKNNILREQHTQQNNCNHQTIKFYCQKINSLEYQVLQKETQLKIKQDKLIQDHQQLLSKQHTIYMLQIQLEKIKDKIMVNEHGNITKQFQIQCLRKNMEKLRQNAKIVENQKNLYQRYLLSNKNHQQKYKNKDWNFRSQNIEDQIKIYTERNAIDKQKIVSTHKNQINRVKQQAKFYQPQIIYNKHQHLRRLTQKINKGQNQMEERFNITYTPKVFQKE